jgi:polyisoprenoid-binding protein YceI
MERTMTSTTSFAQLTGDYTLDAPHSRIGFTARYAMVTKVRGSFNQFVGSIHVDGDEPAKSTADLTITTASIDTRNADRDGHLRSGDFLLVEEFPQITFVSTETKQTGDDTFDVTGDLTIKDITRPVTIALDFVGANTDPYGQARVNFEGSATISRKEFGVTWNAALETGGVVVGDKIVLDFEISAIKSA